MAQYQSRIHIQVTQPAVWEKFRDADDAEFDLAALAEAGETSFVFDDWSCDEDELNGIVAALADTLGTDGIIVADTTNINTDPYAYIVWWAGHGVRQKNREFTEYCFNTSISDLPGCLNFENNFTFNANELDVLAKLGYERIKEGRSYTYREILVNEGLEDELFLTETALEGRTQRLENLQPGDVVELKHMTKDKTYKNKVEVFGKGGSLGLLDETAAAIMAPILDGGEKYFTAEVRTVLPLSKRAARYRTGLVSIHIQFCDPPAAEEAPAAEATPAGAAAPAAAPAGDGEPFDYRHIDGVDASFYEGICTGGALAKAADTALSVTVDGKTVNVKLQTAKKMAEIQKTFGTFLEGKKSKKLFYDPVDAVDGHLTPVGYDDYGNEVFEVTEDAQTLTEAQIAHRVKVFAKVDALLRTEAALAKVIAAAPKKKNGTLYAKRVTQVATLLCMDKDTVMYTICAVAKSDADLLVEIRKLQVSSLEKAEGDVLSQTDLFRA